MDVNVSFTSYFILQLIFILIDSVSGKTFPCFSVSSFWPLVKDARAPADSFHRGSL